MAPNVVWLRKMAPKICRKTSEDHFLQVTPQKRSAKVTRQLFGKKSFAPPKICLLIHLWHGISSTNLLNALFVKNKENKSKPSNVDNTSKKTNLLNSSFQRTTPWILKKGFASQKHKSQQQRNYNAYTRKPTTHLRPEESIPILIQLFSATKQAFSWNVFASFDLNLAATDHSGSSSSNAIEGQPRVDYD